MEATQLRLQLKDIDIEIEKDAVKCDASIPYLEMVGSLLLLDD